VYEHANEIPWERLPEKFVLKTTHASNLNIICTNKGALHVDVAKAKLDQWLETNYYQKYSREWQYNNIHPRILAEEFLEGEAEYGLMDYKFFCFFGVPLYIQVDLDRFSKHSRVFFDSNWNKQEFSLKYPTSEKDIPRPDKFEEIKEVARKLFAGIPFCSVDLYAIRNRIVFGEMTFHPEGGFGKFTPEKYDLVFGNLIELRKWKTHNEEAIS
jgi:hypothetical protein